MYIVEGNIGAGKTTFLSLLAKQLPHFEVIFEPLDSWHSQENGQSLLSHFYTEPQRWAYTLETLTMISRVKSHLTDQQRTNAPFIMERSIYSGHYCFALNGYETGFMSSIEWNIYNEWFKFLITGKCKAPHGFIYLQTTPENSFNRIQKRSRNGESSIPLEYVEQIHKRHDDFLVHKKNLLPELHNLPVLILDANEEFENQSAMMEQHAEKVALFIAQTQQTKPLVSKQKEV